MHETAAHGIATLLWPAINLSLLIALLYKGLKAPVIRFVRERHHSVAHNLKHSQDVLKEARSRYEEFSLKLKSLDQEVGVLKEEARKDAQATQARIADQSKRLSESIHSDAKAAAASLLEELREDLYHEFTARAVRRAEEIVIEKLTAADRARVREDFLKDMEASR